MNRYELLYDQHTGALTGAVRDGNLFVPKSAPAWPEVESWAAAQAPPLSLADRAPPSAAERLARTRAAAAALVVDGGPDRLLLRAALKLLHARDVEQAAWNAKVRQRLTLAGLGDPGAPPVVHDWTALLSAIEAALRGGEGDAPAPTPTPTV